MAIRIDFSPLAHPMLNAPLAVSILESYDPHLQAAVDASTAPYRGQKFSLLVLAEYSEQCKANGVMHRGESEIRDWARNNFDRSPFYRMVAVDTVFSKIIRDARGEYLTILTQIRELRRDLGSRVIVGIPDARFTMPAHLSHVPTLAALETSFLAADYARAHVPVGRSGASWPTSPRAHITVGSATVPYGFPVASRGPASDFARACAAAGAPASRGPAAGGHVGVGSRR
ncbi:MAG: hypothetical protein NTX49_04505 [Chlamydiae bacterium]|nr:hypothetical protein [Chlamydiota bacterium]